MDHNDTKSHNPDLLILGLANIRLNKKFYPLNEIIPGMPVLAFVAIAVLLMAGCSSTQAATVAGSQDPGKIIVVATIPVLADLARNVGRPPDGEPALRSELTLTRLYARVNPLTRPGINKHAQKK